MTPTPILSKKSRKFLPENFSVTDWPSLEPWFTRLLQRELSSPRELETWLEDCSELESVISEDACWRQIRMTCDTTNKKAEEAFLYFVTELQPRIQPYADQLNRKLIDCSFTAALDTSTYFTYLRNVRKQIELFREANIPLLSELSVLSQQYSTVCGKMTIEVEGKEYTLPQAGRFLEQPDRSLREQVYRKIQERRLQDKDLLNDLLTRLIQKRHQVATQTGFANYRDYKFKEMGRFDYRPEDCVQFHEAVQEEVVPLVNELYLLKKKKLGLEVLKPWDLEAEPEQVKPLRPFETGAELLTKTTYCLDQLDPYFGHCLRTMKEMKRFDLESRKGKAPGGYNCPLAETGAPFIFMNASGQMSDVTTLMHEGGHAVHSFLTHSLALTAFKEAPIEMAEVASMAMELFSMDHWQVFFPDPEDVKRAKLHQLERVITIFPWIAMIDQFQHWLYEHPEHTLEERTAKWLSVIEAFRTPAVDLTGLEPFLNYSWQKQLHIYEVPFYYIEYGIAQLGAIGLWKIYREDAPRAIRQYKAALQQGGMKTLPALYRCAGIDFNFTRMHIKELMQFVKN
ncbi:MAG: M3 family oligoendopeptidase, partial [Chitinophagaceae bacterium]